MQTWDGASETEQVKAGQPDLSEVAATTPAPSDTPSEQAVGVTVEQEIYQEPHPSDPHGIDMRVDAVDYNGAVSEKKQPWYKTTSFKVASGVTALATVGTLAFTLGKEAKEITRPEKVERDIDKPITPPTTETQPEIIQESLYPEPSYLTGTNPEDLMEQLDRADTNLAMTADARYFMMTRDMSVSTNKITFEDYYENAVKHKQYIDNHPGSDYRVEINRFNPTYSTPNISEAMKSGKITWTVQYEKRRFHETLPEEGEVLTDAVATETLVKDESGYWFVVNVTDIVQDVYSQ